MEWLLFGTLTVGGIALAYFKERLYGFVPLLTMLVNAVMFLVWPAFDAPNDTHFAITLLSFAGIYMTAGYMMLRRAQIPVLWGTLMGLTGVIYFLLAYWKVDTPDIHLFWGTIGLTLAAFCVYMVHEIQQKFRPCVTAQYLLAIFTIATVTFVSLALSIELKREYLSIAFASEIVVIAWLNTRLSIAALRPVAAILGCVFAMILLPQLWLMVQLAVYSITEMQLTPERIPPIVSYPWFQLGLPALMFIGSGYYLRAATASEAPRTWRSDVDKPDWLALSLETAAVALVGLMCYYITRNAMHAGENIFAVKPGFFERGLLTNIFFIYGLACIWVGRKFYRLSFSVSGFVLCGFALFRIIYFDMMIRNPLWNDEMVGSWPLLNALLLTYGLPIAWTSLTAQELRWFDKNQTLTQWIQGLRAFVLILLFVLVSLNVRQLFHGEFLEGVNTSNAEVYSYSAAWLLLGVGLLIAGIAKRSQMIRYASLGVLLLTVGKVFLYDASELEGLYRVFSFFGLGLCLIGMSYFYTRFVFVKTGRNDDR